MLRQVIDLRQEDVEIEVRLSRIAAIFLKIRRVPAAGRTVGAGITPVPSQRSLQLVVTGHADMSGIESGERHMQEFSRNDIVNHRFTSGRRKGYDPLEVDGYLERLAEYVGWMQGELARRQASERTALEVLQQAQRVADETVATAQRDADKLRQDTEIDVEEARQEAHSMLDAARAEADHTLLSARAQAESATEQARSQLAELEAAGQARLEEANRLVERMTTSAAVCASDFRSAGSRLIEMADQFESEFDAPCDQIHASDDVVVDLHETRVEVI